MGGGGRQRGAWLGGEIEPAVRSPESGREWRRQLGRGPRLSGGVGWLMDVADYTDHPRARMVGRLGHVQSTYPSNRPGSGGASEHGGPAPAILAAPCRPTPGPPPAHPRPTRTTPVTPRGVPGQGRLLTSGPPPAQGRCTTPRSTASPPTRRTRQSCARTGRRAEKILHRFYSTNHTTPHYYYYTGMCENRKAR